MPLPVKHLNAEWMPALHKALSLCKSQADLVRKLNSKNKGKEYRYDAVSVWLLGKVRISLHDAIALEKATDGKVSRVEFFPKSLKDYQVKSKRPVAKRKVAA